MEIEEIKEPELTVELTGYAKDMASTQNSENELKENPMSIKYDMPDNRDGNRDELKSQEYHVGESNYSSKKIQPWDIWEEYGLDPWRADIVKRVLRTKAGQGDLDLKKIMHIAQHLLEKDYNIKMSIREED